MKQRPVPSAVDNDRRLVAVEAIGLLGSEPEEAFDRLTRLATTVLGAPLALVTLVDSQRSCYKSRVGAPSEGDPLGEVEDWFCQYVADSGERLIVDDVRSDPRTADNAATDSMGVAAWAGYPIRGPAGQVLGCFCVGDTAPRQWTERDLEVLDTLSQAVSGEIALRLALADSERRQVITTALARTLQQSLLPPMLPDVPGLEVAAEYLPAGGGAEVVGDFYDVFEGVAGSWCAVIGDVCGKGPDAAALTALARYTLRAAALRSVSPVKALLRLNEVLMHQGRADDRHATVALANIRRQRGHAHAIVGAAGHPIPLLRRADGEVRDSTSPGMAVGWFEHPSVVATKTDLNGGDRLIFYTDGVTEARHGQHDFGVDRLRTIVSGAGGTAAETAAALMAAVAEFRDGPPTDDTAVLVVHVVPSSAPPDVG
jgi:sigma-B regulation protein RsbU (phosphoserine phosphatase)